MFTESLSFDVEFFTVQMLGVSDYDSRHSAEEMNCIIMTVQSL